MLAPASGFIVDCSMTMAWCFEDETTSQTDAVLDRLETESAFVPTLWSLEVANVLRSAERRGRLIQEKAEKFLVTLQTLPIFMDREAPDRAWDEILPLARIHSLTPYDAAYLELALRLGLPLATLDKELCLAAASLGVILL